MPMVLPVLGAAFLAASTVAVAVGVATAVAVGLAVAGLALSVVGFLVNRPKVPAVESQGQQLDLKLDPKAPVPVCYGRTAAGGTLVYRATYGAKNATLAMVAALSIGPIAAVESYTANDHRINFSNDPTFAVATAASVDGMEAGSKLYKNKLRMRHQLGATPAPNTVEEAIGQTFPDQVGKLSGLAHAIQICEYDQDAFPQGAPKGLWVLRGVSVYDPRKDSTYPGGAGSHRVNNPATFEYSENPYLCALDWTLGRHQGPENKRVYGIGAAYSEIDVAAFVEGANVSDANGWKIGGIVTTGDNKYAVLSTMLASGGGQPIARGAQISCLTFAPKVSLFTLTSSDTCGAVEIQSTTSWRDRKNTVTPSYREETQLWEVVAGEQISAAQYVAEDGGNLKTYGIEFPMVQQADQAHQLACYDLLNRREFLTFKVKCKPKMLRARAGDAITVYLPELSAFNQKCVVTSREYDPASFEVALTVRSETDGKHAFALGQSQTPPPSPSLSTYDPSNPPAPIADSWTFTGTALTNADGVSVPAIIVSGAVGDNPYVGSVIIEYRQTGQTEWQQYGSYPRNTTSVQITSLVAETAYDIAVSYRLISGGISPRLTGSATTGAQVVGDANTVGGLTPGQLVDQVAAQIDPVLADLNSELTEVRAETTQVRDDLAAEVARAIGAEGSITTSLTSIEQEVDNAVVALNDEITTRATADTALGNRATSLEAKMAGTQASGLKSLISDEATVRANAVSAVANRTTTIESKLDTTTPSPLLAKITAEETTRAAADAVLASRTTNVEARMSVTDGTSVLTNGSFANWPDGQENPTGWHTWSAAGGYTISRTPGQLGSQYAIRTNSGAGQNSGPMQTLFIPAGKWAVEVTVRRNSGSLSGAGVSLSGVHNLDFLSDPDMDGAIRDSTDTETRTWSKTFDIAAGSWNFHLMSGWVPFSRTVAAHEIDWFKVSLRPIGADGRLAYTNAARITNEETTRANADTALANRATTIESKLALGTDSELYARIRSEETTRANAVTAVANRTTSLETGTANLGARVSTTESAVNDLNGRTSARLQFQTVAGNNRAQITMVADSAVGAGIDIVGDVAFRGKLNVGPDSGGSRTKITDSGVSVYDANGTLRVKLGLF